MTDEPPTKQEDVLNQIAEKLAELFILSIDHKNKPSNKGVAITEPATEVSQSRTGSSPREHGEKQPAKRSGR